MDNAKLAMQLMYVSCEWEVGGFNSDLKVFSCDQELRRTLSSWWTPARPWEQRISTMK